MLTQIKAQAAMLKNLLAAGGLLAGGYLLATLGWSFNLPTLVIRERIPESNSNPVCSEIVQPKAVLSREQLAQLMTVPERSARRKVQQIIKEPYCRLPSLSIRVGATTEREIYPLAFEPQTSLVILYEGETFVGYGFKKS